MPFRVGTDAADATLTARVLVVESHPIVSWALLQHLAERSGVVADSTPDVAGALRALAADRVDVAIVDGSLPEVGTGRVLSMLRSAQHDLAVVVRGAAGAAVHQPHDDAACFLPVEADTDAVVDALRTTLQAARSGATGERLPVPRPGGGVLSRRETQVMELLRDGLALPAVAATLNISMSTTKTHVARIYLKLGATSRTEALMHALRLGLVDAQARRTG